MLYRQLFKTFSFVLVLSCFAAFSISANENALTVDEEHRGTVQISEQFSVFPEARPGNSVYDAKGKIFSEKGLTVKDAVSVPGGVLFYGVNESEESVLRFSGDEENRFELVAPGYWQLKTPKWVSKIYRINAEQKIEDILPTSRTGNGLVYNGKDRVAFFHIFSSKQVEDSEGKATREYLFKIHVLKKDWKERSTLTVILKNSRPSVPLSWVSRKELKYSLSNGESKVLSVP